MCSCLINNSVYAFTDDDSFVEIGSINFEPNLSDTESSSDGSTVEPVQASEDNNDKVSLVPGLLLKQNTHPAR